MAMVLYVVLSYVDRDLGVSLDRFCIKNKLPCANPFIDSFIASDFKIPLKYSVSIKGSDQQ